MWELVIALGISIPTSPNMIIEPMPDKNTCIQVADSFKFQNSTNSNVSFAYCRPKKDK